jgi:hypothetical protein
MVALNSDLETSRKDSIVRCCKQIEYLSDTNQTTTTLHQILIISTILLGGLASVPILWRGLPRPIQALPSALAAMAVAIDKTFSPRKVLINCSYIEVSYNQYHKLISLPSFLAA